MLVIQMAWIVKVKEGVGNSPNQNIQSSYVRFLVSLPAEWPTGGEARKGFGRLAIRPYSGKFHRNFICCKIVVDNINGFDMGSTEGTGTGITLETELESIAQKTGEANVKRAGG